MDKKKLLISASLIMVAFLTDGCSPKGWDMYAPGENLTSLTKITDMEDICEYPYGGDNGRNLFFSVRDKRGISRNIYKRDIPTSGSVIQKTAGKNDNRHSSFCAATDKLVFSGKQEGAYSSDIYMMDASQGNALTQVTNTPDATEYFPCISRDGKAVVYQKFSTYSNNLKDCEIWIKNLQTGENTMLCLGRMPSFSTDGTEITFIKYAADGTSTSIWTMKKDGTNQMQLTDAKMGLVENPRFSPDNRNIVFVCSKKGKKDADLYVVDRNGNNLTQLTVNKSYDGEPYWANDGNIYFSSDRGGRVGHYQIWRFRYGNASYSQPYVPQANPTPAPNPAPTPKQSTVNTYSGAYHTVAEGETITDIARRYGITVRDVVKWNELKTMTITPGMKLKVSAQ